MTKKEKMIKDTTEDWRELGFFYDVDEEAQAWTIVGSISGIMKFSQILSDYAANPTNKQVILVRIQ
jgi:hypothetical protein